MDNVNKTLYIPLFGKAYVSKKGIILDDKRAEYIWEQEGFKLKGKSKSKWLAYYMGMRSAVFDEWVKSEINNSSNSTVLHIGCGMDSRVERIGMCDVRWYDVDFPDVIEERKKYYKESEMYKMVSADARTTEWIQNLAGENAIVVLEGISMYFEHVEMKRLLRALGDRFDNVRVLMDCYTERAAKASRYKNPINDVGVTKVYGTDEPHVFEENTGFTFVKEHDMTPKHKMAQLKGMERFIFKHVFGGKISKGMYRMYEYEKLFS